MDSSRELDARKQEGASSTGLAAAVRHGQPAGLQTDRPCGSNEPVAYFVSRFPKLTETFILREIAELERHGQRVELFSLLRHTEAPLQPEAAAILPRVRYRPLLSWGVLAANIAMLSSRPRRYLRAAGGLAAYVASPSVLLKSLAFFPSHVHLAREIESLGLRHVHAHFATYPAQAALVVRTLTRIGFSFTAHAHDILIRFHRAGLVEKLRAARFVVTVSRYNRDYLARLAPDVPVEKIRVVRCGLDASEFEPRRAVPHDGPLRLVSIARLTPYKGLDDLVRACARLRVEGLQLRCTVVGEGPERDRLRGLIDDLGLEGAVELVGGKSQPEVRRILATADVFVLASRVMPNGETEGVPVSIMEAMAAALPVVATAVSGIPELIEDERSGLLVPPDDTVALAAAIARLAGDADLRRLLGEAARERVERAFRLDEQARLLAELFREALREPFPDTTG